MSLSGHFVTGDWQLKCHTLQMREVASSYSAANLAMELTKSIEEWKMQEKVFIVTTDNGSNIKNAIQLI